MSLTVDRKMLSNILSAGWSTDGEHRRRCWTHGLRIDHSRCCLILTRETTALPVMLHLGPAPVRKWLIELWFNDTFSTVRLYRAFTRSKECSYGSLTVSQYEWWLHTFWGSGEDLGHLLQVCCDIARLLKTLGRPSGRRA